MSNAQEISSWILLKKLAISSTYNVVYCSDHILNLELCDIRYTAAERMSARRREVHDFVCQCDMLIQHRLLGCKSCKWLHCGLSSF